MGEASSKGCGGAIPMSWLSRAPVTSGAMVPVFVSLVLLVLTLLVPVLSAVSLLERSAPDVRLFARVCLAGADLGVTGAAGGTVDAGGSGALAGCSRMASGLLLVLLALSGTGLLALVLVLVALGAGARGRGAIWELEGCGAWRAGAAGSGLAGLGWSEGGGGDGARVATVLLRCHGGWGSWGSVQL